MRQTEGNETDKTDQHTPSGPPSRVHILVYLVIDLVRLFVVCFVCRSCEETILIVWVLELFRVDFGFFATTGLSLAIWKNKM